MIMIYHNPRCSKSREALHLISHFADTRHPPLEVIEYLTTPPTPDQLMLLQQQIGCDLRDMVRISEADYARLELQHADDATLRQALYDHPHLLQRPIVVYRNRALIARPPELLTDFWTLGQDGLYRK